MAHLKFKAFMSCSFSEEDQAIVEFFKAYCESFGFEVIKYDFQEPVRLSEGIKDQIKNSDCLIAIATRRGRLDTGEWLCPDWIQHEIVYANAIRKPVAVFAEDDVKIEGLVKKEERWQRFSRDSDELLKKTPYLNRFLIALYRAVEEQFKYGDDTSPSIYLHSIRSRDELAINNTWITTCEIELESLVDDLKHSEERFGDIDWLQLPYEVISDVEFSVLNAPHGAKLKLEHGRSNEDPNLWLVTFNPPLQIGQKVTYAYRYSAKNVRPFTLEEAQKAIASKKYWYDSPLCAVNWDQFTPTGHLTTEVILPSKYPICDAECIVESLESQLPAIKEMERIKQTDAFKILRFYDRFSLILSIPKPIRGLRYKIIWKPPSESEIEKSK